MYSEHASNSFSAKNKQENVLDRISDIKENIHQGRLIEILQDMSSLAASDKGQVFRFGERIRQDHKACVPGEAGVTYPSYEIALEYSATIGEQYDNAQELGFSRAPRTSFLYSADYKRDQITQDLNYLGSKTLQVRYDSMHRATSSSAVTSHEFDTYKAQDELDVAKGIYEFCKNVAPDRAQEVKAIINRHYNGQFQPEAMQDLKFFSAQEEYEDIMTSSL